METSSDLSASQRCMVFKIPWVSTCGLWQIPSVIFVGPEFLFFYPSHLAFLATRSIPSVLFFA